MASQNLGRIPKLRNHGREIPAPHVTELASRSAKVVDSTPEAATLQQELMKQQLLTPDGKKWLYLQWSREKQKLVPTDAEAWDINKAHHVLQEIVAQVQHPKARSSMPRMARQ